MFNVTRCMLSRMESSIYTHISTSHYFYGCWTRQLFYPNPWKKRTQNNKITTKYEVHVVNGEKEIPMIRKWRCKKECIKKMKRKRFLFYQFCFGFESAWNVYQNWASKDKRQPNRRPRINANMKLSKNWENKIIHNGNRSNILLVQFIAKMWFYSFP